MKLFWTVIEPFMTGMSKLLAKSREEHSLEKCLSEKNHKKKFFLRISAEKLRQGCQNQNLSFRTYIFRHICSVKIFVESMSRILSQIFQSFGKKTSEKFSELQSARPDEHFDEMFP